MKNRYSHLQCHQCGEIYSKEDLQSFCHKDSQPLLARYDLTKCRPEELIHSQKGMWKYANILPVEDERNRISLGEGDTPMLALSSLANQYETSHLFLKNESFNPTASFKARGISVAVSKAKELGVQAAAIPTAGNAGSALSAYCSKAGIRSYIFMPKATPKVFQLDCKVMGALVMTVDGTISDATQKMRSENDGSWFDITTLKEPFRLEGKKTMGYEIAEWSNWNLPDVIIYPTGGGTGLIGIWKAFEEMREMGWISHIPTKMVAVQATGCKPIVDAWEKGAMASKPFESPKETIANGLRVPHAFGHKLILKTLLESKGCAIDTTEFEILESIKEFAEKEGIFLSPEGGAVWAAFKKLRKKQWIKPEEKVVLLNTGSPYKYVENLENLI